MNMLFIGDTSCRGTYYWHSQQHNGWVVADLTTGKCSLHDSVVLIRVKYDDGVENALDYGSATLGQDGDKYLVTRDDAFILFSDHADELECLAVNEQSGKVTIGQVAERVFKKLGAAIKRAKG